MVAFLRCGASEELIKDMKCALLVSEPTKTGFVKCKGEHLCGLNPPAVIEVKFQVATMSRCIWAERGLGVSECIKEGVKCLDLTGNPVLLLGMGRETKNLVHKETRTVRLARTRHPAHDQRLRLFSPSHEEIHLRGELVYVRLQYTSALQRQTGIPITAFLILPCGGIICNGEDLARIDGDKMCRPDSHVG